MKKTTVSRNKNSLSKQNTVQTLFLDTANRRKHVYPTRLSN